MPIDPADIQAGDVLVDEDPDGRNSRLMILAIGHPTGWDPRVLGAMYTFIDELPLMVYGPWVLHPGYPIKWSKEGGSSVT